MESRIEPMIGAWIIPMNGPRIEPRIKPRIKPRILNKGFDYFVSFKKSLS